MQNAVPVLPAVTELAYLNTRVLAILWQLGQIYKQLSTRNLDMEKEWIMLTNENFYPKQNKLQHNHR